MRSLDTATCSTWRSAATLVGVSYDHIMYIHVARHILYLHVAHLLFCGVVWCVVLWHGVVWARVGDREGRERVCWLHVVCMFVGVDVGVGGSGG